MLAFRCLLNVRVFRCNKMHIQIKYFSLRIAIRVKLPTARNQYLVLSVTRLISKLTASIIGFLQRKMTNYII